MYSPQFLATAILATTPLVSAHGLIASVTGNLGGKGSRFGIATGGDQNLGDVIVFRSSAGVFGATAVSSLVTSIMIRHYYTNDLFSGWKHRPCHRPRCDDQDRWRHHPSSQQHWRRGDHGISSDQRRWCRSRYLLCLCRCHWEELYCYESYNPGPRHKWSLDCRQREFPSCSGYACRYVGTTANVCLVKCENPVGPFRSVVPVQMPAGKKASGGAVLPHLE
jgi:hypothetical protein